jgi:hypothetical protein
LWLRYHRLTPHFRAISDKLFTSDRRSTLRTDDGHLWLPLTVCADLSGEFLVDDLVNQVHAVHAILQPRATRREPAAGCRGVWMKISVRQDWWARH